MIGLRQLGKELKGYKKIGWKLSKLWLELRLGWQRLWRGYDDTAVWSIDDYFFNIMPVLLREFKEKNVALFNAPADEKDKWGNGNGMLSKEETDQILDEMIMCFECSDPDTMYIKLHGTDSNEDFREAVLYGSNRQEYDEKWKKAEEEAKKCEQRALELFVKWHRELWY